MKVNLSLSSLAILKSCTLKDNSIEDNVRVCLPLYLNLFLFEVCIHKYFGCTCYCLLVRYHKVVKLLLLRLLID